MIEILDPNDRVIDLGCGTGKFLIEAHDKIKYGLGMDGSRSLIDYANSQTKKLGIENVAFEHRMIDQNFKPDKAFTVATACLFFHVIPQDQAAQILKSVSTYAEQMVICAFAPPLDRKQQFFMWLDQRFNSHYQHYQKYCKNGYMEGLIQKCQLSIEETTDTFDPTLKIYTIRF